jgi:hypothetical protein
MAGNANRMVPALTFGSGTHPLRVELTKRGKVHVSGSISCSAAEAAALAAVLLEWAERLVTQRATSNASRNSPGPSASNSAPDGSNGSRGSESAHGVAPSLVAGSV